MPQKLMWKFSFPHRLRIALKMPGCIIILSIENQKIQKNNETKDKEFRVTSKKVAYSLAQNFLRHISLFSRSCFCWSVIIRLAI